MLEIGTGTGYVAAVLSRLARRVYTIDRYRTLVDKARARWSSWACPRGSRCAMPMAAGWPEAAPFDRILLMGAVTELPRRLSRQLAPGGVVVMPVERDGQH